MLTSGSNSPFAPLLAATFSAAIFARAVPHEPEPTMATRCLPDGSGERGSAFGTGDGGRVAAVAGQDERTVAVVDQLALDLPGVVAVEDGMWTLFSLCSSMLVNAELDEDGVGCWTLDMLVAAD